MKKILIPCLLILSSCCASLPDAYPNLIAEPPMFVNSLLTIDLPQEIICTITNLKETIHGETMTAPASKACLEIIYFNEDGKIIKSEYEIVPFDALMADSSQTKIVVRTFNIEATLQLNLYPDFDNQIPEREETEYMGDCG